LHNYVAQIFFDCITMGFELLEGLMTLKDCQEEAHGGLYTFCLHNKKHPSE